LETPKDPDKWGERKVGVGDRHALIIGAGSKGAGIRFLDPDGNLEEDPTIHVVPWNSINPEPA